MSTQSHPSTRADGAEPAHAGVDGAPSEGGARSPSVRGAVEYGGSRPPAGRTRRRLRAFVAPLALLLILAGAFVAYRYWYDGTFYVSTDNAKITGALVQVGALNAGRVETIGVDVGSRVERDQHVATLMLPSAVAVAQGTPKMEFVGSDELRVDVRSPVGGVVVARQGEVGDTLPAGQPILTVVDPNALWVVANVDETKVGRLRRGQSVEVHVDALNRTFPGHVDTVTPATAATFSLLPQMNGSGNFTKVTQLIPVKIALDTQGETLPLGGSVEVRIHVAQPSGWLAWLP